MPTPFCLTQRSWSGLQTDCGVFLTVSATDLLSGYSDPEGTELTVSNSFMSAGTVVDNDDGTFTVEPEADHYSSVTLSYQVVDGDGEIAAASRAVYFAPVNDDMTRSMTEVSPLIRSLRRRLMEPMWALPRSLTTLTS